MAESRQQERGLLFLAGLVMLCGVLAVSMAKGRLDYSLLCLSGAWITGFVLVNLLLEKAGFRGDQLLLPLAMILNGIGLVAILRLKPELFYVQLVWAAAGLTVFGLSVWLARRLEAAAAFKYVCGFIGVVLLLTAIVFGVEIGGHKSWVIIGPIRFQPAEFAKLFIVLFLAGYLSERRELLTVAVRRIGPFTVPQLRFIAPLLLVWSVAMLMFVLQRDMGAALLYFSIAVIMAYMVSGQSSYLLAGGVSFLVGSAACYKLYGHIKTRVDIWLNPWLDPTGGAYQVVQSLFAFAAGGVLGSGLTYGYPAMIPEVHTDFIFAAIGEELGFAGAGAVLLLYMVLVWRAFRSAVLARHIFSMLVAGGLAAAMALQIFLIVGGVTKFFPLTGITLPFISYGGSSMVANFIVLGMLLAISEAGAEYEQ